VADQFELRLPNGDSVFTGNKIPDSIPVSYQPFPDNYYYSLDDIYEIIKYRETNATALEIEHADNVTNQGRRSSCNAYMVYWMLAKLTHSQLGYWPKLGPEHLYERINGGVDEGSHLDDGMVEATDGGMPKREVGGKLIVPYEAFRKGDFDVEQMRLANQDMVNHRFIETYQAPRTSVEKCWHSIISCCAGHGVAGLAIHAGENYMRSGVMAGFDQGPGNHAVPGAGLYLLTDGRPKSIADIAVKSPQSWSKQFANNGFTNLVINHVAETMQYHAHYLARSVSTDNEIFSNTRIN